MNDVQESVSAPSSSTPDWKVFLLSPKGRFIAAAVLIAAVLGLTTWQVYSRPVTDPFVRFASNIIPYPALSVDGTTVSIRDFLLEYDALQSYFEDLGESAPAGDQLEIAIADTLINKIAIKALAKQYGIELDADRVEQYYQEVLSSQESEEAFKESLTQTFGWTTEEFKSRIVESIVLALQMSESILADTGTQESRRSLVDEAYARVQAGEDFAVVAKDVHGGFEGIESDLGYVKASVLPESWASQVNALEQGQMTQVIDLPEGYVIFRLEEKILAGEETQLHLISITVPKISLEEVVDDYITSVSVKRYVGEE